MPWLLQILYLSVSLVPSTGLARADAQQIFAQWKSIQIYQGRNWSCSCLMQRLALLRGHIFASPAVSFMWRALCKYKYSELLSTRSVPQSKGKSSHLFDW